MQRHPLLVRIRTVPVLVIPADPRAKGAELLVVRYHGVEDGVVRVLWERVA